MIDQHDANFYGGLLGTLNNILEFGEGARKVDWSPSSFEHGEAPGSVAELFVRLKWAKENPDEAWRFYIPIGETDCIVINGSGTGDGSYAESRSVNAGAEGQLLSHWLHYFFNT